MKKIVAAKLDELSPKKPHYALIANVDLVLIRWPDEDQVSVLYGRCLHRGALMSDATIKGQDIVCGVHNWDYQYKTGISSYNPSERLNKFSSWVENGNIMVDYDEISAWEKDNPQNYARDSYLGLYADLHGTEDEPENKYIQHLAKFGLNKLGHHGAMASMGVPRHQLPQWKDIQIITAQLATLPLLDNEAVDTKVVIGKNAKKPLVLDIPLFVSDMSYGALSEEAKVSLAKGAELSGTAICSGEGGMLPEEQQANSKYMYQLASGRFGFSMDKVKSAQAFHFKGGQGAKTGTGGHLPGTKVTGKIAQVRELQEGQDAISPSRFPDWDSIEYQKEMAKEVRKITGGIPIGYKLSAQHIEADIQAALDIGVDYIILDGRGGGTGAAPTIFRDNISVPTIPALARARRYLDKVESDVSLIITGGLRLPEDFIKALALGADAIAVSNSALQAIGCLAMRACNTNKCPVGIATQDEDLRKRLKIDQSAQQLHNFFTASTELIQVMARACGHDSISKFCIDDLTTWDRNMMNMTGIEYGGAN